MDRYQRIVYEGNVEASDKHGMVKIHLHQSTSKLTSIIMQITPVEYYDTEYERERDKIVEGIFRKREVALEL